MFQNHRVDSCRGSVVLMDEAAESVAALDLARIPFSPLGFT
jgi:hypothetical protein